MLIRRSRALVFILTLLFLLNSCSNDVVSKNSNSTIDFQTVVLESSTVKRYFSDPSFNYFLFEYKPTFFGGVLLEVTAFDIHNAIMEDKIKLPKLRKSKPAPLLNSYKGRYRLTKARMFSQGVDGSTDYVLSPQQFGGFEMAKGDTNRAYNPRIKGTNYVSYRVTQQIQPFRKTFVPFTLDPSPPAP